MAMGRASYDYFSFLKAAALALALGIGVNGAIFGLGGVSRSPEVFPDPASIVFQNGLQPEAADSFLRRVAAGRSFYLCALFD